MSEYIISVSDANKKRADELRCILHTTVGIYKHTEQIVRCKDCKYYRNYEGVVPKDRCERVNYFHDFPVESDGYCAWGKLRDGE